MANLAHEVLPESIGIVHDWFSPNSIGGAEQVVQTIVKDLESKGHSINLSALVDGETHLKESWLSGRIVKTSFIQKLPWGVKHVQKYLPLLPIAIEQLDVSDSSLVISSSHLVAKGVITSPYQLHVSYVHTPVRYAWDQMHVYLEKSLLAKSILGPLIRANLHYLRQWDQLTGARVDRLIANSRFTARRISSYWGRQADVIHPPVQVDSFVWDKPRDDFYLCVCRLVPYKRVDLLIRAFNLLKLPLVVVGDGSEINTLKKLAGPTIQLLGRTSQHDVQDLMSRCKAFVYAGIEDFGIAPVEAMASGAPVIGFRGGGLLDTVRCAASGHTSPTGVFFHEQSVKSIFDCINWFEDRKLWRDLSVETIRKWSEVFRPEAFSRRFNSYLTSAWKDHQNSCNVGPCNFFDL